MSAERLVIVHRKGLAFDPAPAASLPRLLALVAAVVGGMLVALRCLA